jgi:hypothetical protein
MDQAILEALRPQSCNSSVRHPVDDKLVPDGHSTFPTDNGAPWSKDDELTELRSVNEKMAQLSRRILTEPTNPKRKEQVIELGRLKEQARILRNRQLI